MSTVANLPVLLQSQPLLAKVANAMQNSPNISAQFSEELARETQKRVMEQVEKVQKDEKAESINEDRKRERRKQEQELQHRRRYHAQAEPEEEPLAKTPWTGNIINVKI